MATTTAVPAPSPLTRNDIEISTRAADHFTRLYYSTYDSAARIDDLPKFYRPSSSLTWNGNPYQGAEGVRELMAGMPITKHDVQSFDCHPIPGASPPPLLPFFPLSRRAPIRSLTGCVCAARAGTQPPSLLVTVSGNVTHGRGPAGNPPATPVKCIDGQSRVFSQTFMLVVDPSAPPTKSGEVAKYYINADAMRFVG
ncbi:NTF2-like protein [Athelia psychrophila]|uniref:NTF2-like protein n=1 Tax=Athelia psychrophila TaxID=1759441 RepID=A0A166RY42_9AGAM|nr:NTF2-like protein [Fibularhizoctonia sp. CBS 109695]